jgi:sigma-B regulation protein RsbU (phosphoserine phosphatase)
MKRARTFWRRITDGVVLGELWKQFRADARGSYRLYSKEIETSRPPERGRVRHFIWMAKQFLWAIFDKLSPARRVLLLFALIFLIPDVDVLWESNVHSVAFRFGGAFWGGILLLVLLLLEISDRVVMKRDLQIAKEIQAWLLPPEPPAVPGVEIAFATRPANTVAGDYYDVFARRTTQSSGSDYLIAIADVAGKSVPAAMLMATFQASLKTLSATESQLTELAGRMNNYACSNSQNGRRFTTAFIAEYEPASRTLSYVNAGHNPPILRRKAGTIERLQEGGIPLGIQQNAAYQSGAVTLQSGDWLVVFTDGVTEAENAIAEEYGEPRLLGVLNANLAAAPQMLLSNVMMDLDGFVGDAPQHDDITLLLLKVV